MAKQPPKPLRAIDWKINKIKKDFDDAMTPAWLKQRDRLRAQAAAGLASIAEARKRREAGAGGANTLSKK